MPMLPIGNWKLALATLAILATFLAVVPANAENAYTNHAGHAVCGTPMALDRRSVTISNDAEIVSLPLSVFPDIERRRIAADYVILHPESGRSALLVPPEVRKAVDAGEKSMRRARLRAEKGFCKQEECDDFCEKTSAALGRWLDGKVKKGELLPSERRALRR